MESDETAGFGAVALQTGTYPPPGQRRRQVSRSRGQYVGVPRNSGGTWPIEKTILSSDLPQPPIPTAQQSPASADNADVPASRGRDRPHVAASVI
jgi:hypothetical protein